MTRRLFAFALVGVLVVLQTLAHATSPDPTWIAGFWDDADFDDIIIRIRSTSGTAETHALCALEPHWTQVRTVPLADDLLTPSRAPAPCRPRGPPLS